jgi:hypothetical protein
VEQPQLVQLVQLLIATNVPHVQLEESSHLLAHAMYARQANIKIKMDLLTATASIALLAITLEQHQPAVKHVQQVCTRLPTHLVERPVPIALLDLRLVPNRRPVLNALVESTKPKTMLLMLVVLVGPHVQRVKKEQCHLPRTIASARIAKPVKFRRHPLSKALVVVIVLQDLLFYRQRQSAQNVPRERINSTTMPYQWRAVPGALALQVITVAHLQHRKIESALRV